MIDDNIFIYRLLHSVSSDVVFQISLLCVIILCINFSYLVSLFSGLLIIGFYLGGVTVCNILWSKQYLTEFFSRGRSSSETTKPVTLTGCTLCGDSTCKRQKSTKDTQPWLGLNIPKEVDQAIQDLLNKILNEFVTSWHSNFSKDDSFVYELRRCMRYAGSVLLRRVLQVDVGEVITDHLVTTGLKHVNDYVQIIKISKTENVSVETAAVRHLNIRLHPAVTSRKSELQYLRTLCSQLSVYLLQPSQLQCLSFNTLIRELLAGWVLLPLSDTLCDPYCINTLILLALSHEPLTQYPENQIVQVQFLQRFVTQNKNQAPRKSALLFDLSVILKDQKLLYTFMQFLKKEGAVNILQFCLDVEEFSKKIISDLTDQDKDNLHKEAWDLYSVYFKPDSPDSVHLPKQIVDQMEQVLKEGAENIVRLRTSPPLFKAYEIAYAILDEAYCPLFHQSDYFFPLLFDSQEVIKNSKASSRNLKRGGEMSTVAKLSNKFQKFLQFQAVDGKAFFPDSPYDMPDTECTEDLNLGLPCEVMWRDMSTWRVTIPSVSTRQDANSKPYPIFTINVIDIGPKDQNEDSVKLKWNVERRNNDFYALQAKLTEFHGDFGEGIQLPAKTGIFSPRGSEFLESRRQIEFLTASGSKSIGRIKHATSSTTVAQLKMEVHKLNKKLYPDRQSLRLEAKGKSLRDEDTLKSLNLGHGSKLYVKDLGPQIGWTTVFLAEYAGPLVVYLCFYSRPLFIYGSDACDIPKQMVVHIAAACYTFHYVKRILETLFVHRFSHATMPLMNLFKNCGYYWLFTAYVAYHINHPLYTSPSLFQVFLGLAAFILCEIGNYSIHVALRDLRPPGTKVRKIPMPTSNPFTFLFNYVSCPNYTYEFGSWISFTIMTQCLPAGLFALAGMYQMTVWALGKHRNYRKEFPNYPKNRKASIPFIL